MRTCRCDAPGQARHQAIAAAAALALGLAATAQRPPRRIRGRRGRRCRRPRSASIRPGSTGSRTRRGGEVELPGRGSRWEAGGRVVLPRDASRHGAGRVLGDEVVRRARSSGSPRTTATSHRDSASRWISQWRGTPSAGGDGPRPAQHGLGPPVEPLHRLRAADRCRDRTAFAIGLGQEAAPGTVWAYNNSAVQTLQRVLENATGDARCRLRKAAPVRAARDGAHVAVHRRGRQRADVRGHPLDLPRPGALRRPDARPRNWSGRQIVSPA